MRADWVEINGGLNFQSDLPSFTALRLLKFGRINFNPAREALVVNGPYVVGSGAPVNVQVSTAINFPDDEMGSGPHTPDTGMVVFGDITTNKAWIISEYSGKENSPTPQIKTVSASDISTQILFDMGTNPLTGDPPLPGDTFVGSAQGIAELDCSTVAANYDAVISASDAYAGIIGNTLTIQFVSAGAESLVEAAPAITINYNSGVSTVASINALIAGATLIRVSIPGTLTNTLVAPGDTFGPTNLIGGTDYPALVVNTGDSVRLINRCIRMTESHISASAPAPSYWYRNFTDISIAEVNLSSISLTSIIPDLAGGTANKSTTLGYGAILRLRGAPPLDDHYFCAPVFIADIGLTTVTLKGVIVLRYDSATTTYNSVVYNVIGAPTMTGITADDVLRITAMVSTSNITMRVDNISTGVSVIVAGLSVAADPFGTLSVGGSGFGLVDFDAIFPGGIAPFDGGANFPLIDTTNKFETELDQITIRRI